MVYELQDTKPEYSGAIFIAPSAAVIGLVSLGDDTSVWFGAVIRGDMAAISLGDGTNIQDGAVIHVDTGFPTSIGAGVTVGHQAIVHGCTVADNVLIGMGSRILNGAIIAEDSIIGAGAVVPPGKHFPPRSLLVGVPARVVREVTDDEIAETRANAEHYVANARRYAAEIESYGV